MNVNGLVGGCLLSAALLFSCTKAEEADNQNQIEDQKPSAWTDEELKPREGEVTEDGRPVVMVFGAGISQDKQPIPEPEQPAEEENPSDEGEMNSEPEDTRTALHYQDATTYNNYWSDGDRVSINGVSSGALKTGDGYVGTKSARFPMAEVVPQYEDYWYYGFPSDQFAFEDGVGTVTIPDSQNYVEGSYDPRAFIMVGKSTTQALTFYPKVSLIRITAKDATTPYDYKIAKVRLESIGGEALSGTFTTDYNNASSTFTAASGHAYVEINAPDGGLDFGTQFFFCVPAGRYEKGLRFIVYAKDGTSMTFSNTASFTAEVGTAHNIGSPKYEDSPSTFADAPVLGEITSSTLSISWHSHVTDNDYAKRWRIYVSTSNDFTTGVREVEIYPTAGSWIKNQTPLTFTVGRLNPGAKYYVKVLDVGNHIFTPVSDITLSASPFSQTMPVENISATGMILSENFSEIGWGTAFYNDVSYGGFYPTISKGGSDINKRTFDYLDVDDNTTFLRGGDDLNFELPRFNEAYEASRLNGWLYQGSTYFKNGFMKLGKTGAAGYLLTPPILLADGKKAEVKVKVKAAKYDGATNNAWAIAVLSGVTNSGRAVSPAFTYPSSDNVIKYRTVTVSEQTWSDYLTVEGLYVEDGDRIVFGFPQDIAVSGTNARVYLGYLSIEVTALTDDFIIHDETTLAAFNDAVVGGDTDLNARVACNFTVSSSAAAAWTPIDGYEGTLDGNGKTITGLTRPFFADLQGAVHDLTLHSEIEETANDAPYTAIFAERLNGTMSDCISQGSVTFQPSSAVTDGTERYIAGLVGRVQSGTMTDCSNEATISVPDNEVDNDFLLYCGGAVGSLETATSGSSLSNSGDVSVGITVNPASTVRTGCLGGVVGAIPNVGTPAAIDGFTNSGDLEYTGSIKGDVYIGGIIGLSYKGISNCTNSGTITSSGSMTATTENKRYYMVGGVAGRMRINESFSNNRNIAAATINHTGTSSDYTIVGGLVGYCSGAISGCRNHADVSFAGSGGNSVCLAGIVGRMPTGYDGLSRVAGSANYGAISLTEGASLAGKTIYVSGISAHQQSGNVTASNYGSISVDGLHCSHLLVGAICGSGNKDGTYSILVGSRNYDSGDISVANVTATDNSSIGGLCGNAYGNVAGINEGNITITSSSASDATNLPLLCIGGLSGRMLSSSSLLGSTTEANTTYNTGEISNAASTGDNDLKIGGLVGNCAAPLSNCYNAGRVSNSGGSATAICMGGLMGDADAVTMTGCYNTGAVSNSGAATSELYLGGLAGYARNDNTFTSTAQSKNYNNAAITESSASTLVKVGGVVGFADSASTDLELCENRSAGVITLQGNTRTTVYVGGVLACTSASTTFDYASNAGHIIFDGLDISGQVFAGGVLGAFTASGTQTITGCINSGEIKTKTEEVNTDLKSSVMTKMTSFFGGISGIGGSNRETSGDDDFAACTITGKSFSNCTNAGQIYLRPVFRYCVGGVLAYSENNPSECSCVANISVFKPNNKSVPTSYGTGRSYCGGVIGYCTATTISNLKFNGRINTNGSSPFAYTGCIVGLTTAGTTFSYCKMGGYVRAANDNNIGASGLFCNANGNYNYSFSNCTVASGTVISNGSSSTNFTVTDATIGSLTVKLCCRRNGAPTNTDGSLSTGVSVGSID